MEGLPAELVRTIFANLEAPDLLAVACVRYHYYPAALAQLFSELTFYADPYTADLTAKSAQLLVQLHSDRDVKGASFKRTGLVRAITVSPYPGPCFRVTPRAFRTLYTTFFQLLRVESIRCSLQVFRWRVGCPESVERFPILFPAHLRRLDCAACQVDSAALFPSLRTLALRRTRGADGAWVSRQIRQCKLEHLAISGCSDTDTVSSSSFAGEGRKHLGALKFLELEYVHVDVWPLPTTAQLDQLVFRLCVEDGGAYAPCIDNLSRLRALTIVSAHDVWDLAGFNEMLWSCTELRELTLLVGGRTANIPLSGFCRAKSSLQVLVLEARLFSVAPALSYQYTVDDVHMLLAAMPNLRVLGVSVDLSEKNASTSLPSACTRLRVLHLRNWLTPREVTLTVERMARYLAAVPACAKNYDTLAIVGDQCYKVVSDARGSRMTSDSSDSSDYAICRQYTVPWHAAL